MQKLYFSPSDGVQQSELSTLPAGQAVHGNEEKLIFSLDFSLTFIDLGILSGIKNRLTDDKERPFWLKGSR